MPQPVTPSVIESSKRQHKAVADKFARQIVACANKVIKHLEDGQPAMPAARQIGSDLLELMAELGKLSEDARFASWVQQPADRYRKPAA